jgi:multidrug transporter EmrE-like cation transporter
MWFRLMMLAFFLNGLCTFGLRILASLGWAGKYTPIYLVFWYLAGGLFILVLVWRARRWPTRSDILVGAALGVFSVCGQTSMGLALANGLPGNVVFPVALGGGLFVVVLAAILVFKERIGPAGVAGISLGILSIALLSLN